MIRLLVAWNIAITAILAVILVSNRHNRLDRTPSKLSSSQAGVLRARRLEVVDKEGHLTAVLGEDTEGSTGGLSLFDPNGRRSVVLELNNRGYGMLYFQAKHTEAKVTVGYFTGNDQEVPLSEEDPEGGWGLRVLRPNFGAPQVFGVQGDGRPIPTSK